jgi:hypothetical protein
MVSVLAKPEVEEPARLVLQFLQRFGSFLKFLSWKKCCSPAVNTKSAPQSTHLRMRSWKSAISTLPRYQPVLVGLMAGAGEKSQTARPAIRLFDLPAILLPVSLACQRLLSPQLLTRLQVKGVSLDLLDNVLLLDLPLEAAKGVF